MQENGNISKQYENLKEGRYLRTSILLKEQVTIEQLVNMSQP